MPKNRFCFRYGKTMYKNVDAPNDSKYNGSGCDPIMRFYLVLHTQCQKMMTLFFTSSFVSGRILYAFVQRLYSTSGTGFFFSHRYIFSSYSAYLYVYKAIKTTRMRRKKSKMQRIKTIHIRAHTHTQTPAQFIWAIKMKQTNNAQQQENDRNKRYEELNDVFFILLYLLLLPTHSTSFRKFSCPYTIFRPRLLKQSTNWVSSRVSS